MTRVALTKLCCLVILTFIMCLPEVFIINRELRVSLLCVRPPLRDEESGEQRGDERSNGSTCGEHREQMRAAADQRNMTQADGSRFVCQAEVNVAGLDHSSSSPAETVSVEVSATLRQSHNASADITLLGRYNRSSRYLHFPDEEAREGDGLLYCPPLVDAANRSCCLLWLSAQTFAPGGLPWKRSAEGEWSCVLWAVGLFLLGALLLLVALAVTHVAEGRGRCSDRAKIRRPFDYTGRGRHLTDNGNHQDVSNTANGLHVDKGPPYAWSALSSIEEEDSSDVFYDDETDDACNGTSILSQSGAEKMQGL